VRFYTMAIGNWGRFHGEYAYFCALFSGAGRFSVHLVEFSSRAPRREGRSARHSAGRRGAMTLSWSEHAPGGTTTPEKGLHRMSGDASRGDSLTYAVPTQRSPLPEVAAYREGYVQRLRRQSPSLAVGVLPLLVLGLDLMIIAATMALADYGRDRLGIFDPVVVELGMEFLLAAPLIAIAWIGLIALSGGYEHQVLGAGTDEYRRVINASLLTAAVVGMACYVLRFELPRGFFGLALIGGPVLLVFGRRLVRQLVKRARVRGLLSHRVLIVGSEAHVDEVASVLDRESWLGYRVVGALAPGATRRTSTKAGVPIIGSATGVAGMAQDVGADVVFFAGGGVSSAAELRRVAWELEHSACQVVVAPSLTDVSRERVRVRPVGGLPLLHLEKPRAAKAARKAKRTFDVVGSGTLLLLLSPLLLFAAFRIWSHDRGPILFRQQRIGRDGETFDCLKFRTMVVDAEARLADVHEQQGSSTGVFVKIKDDPRITPPGNWLRRFSVDELPQLINVLRGDMSLVGPRPQVAHEVALYDKAMSRRLRVRPGMTGLWQVSGRSDLSLEEAIRLDLYYVDNWSMVQDLVILARTFRAVVGSEGAY
jgi:exopolysaccharide biosynthesis polyprenyl glycosylphosphotransferase